MTIGVHIPASLSRFLDAVKSAGRRNLFSAAANALKIEVQNHLRREATRRHQSAHRLGGTPTQHLVKGAARVTFAADENHGEVVIPIAGMSRAFRDVTILPTRARALTLPVHGEAYGHRVSELRRLGWNIFRPKGKDVLMGDHGDGKVVSLYALKKRVQQRQDRSLLPDDHTINTTVARAMMREIQRTARKAG